MPRAALPGTVTVNVDVLVAGLGLKAAVAPEGKPLMVSVTAELKPFTGVMLTR